MDRKVAAAAVFDSEMRLDNSTNHATLASLSEGGVGVGFRPVSVDGVRVLTKTAYRDEVRPRKSDNESQDTCIIHFESSVLQDRPGLNFAQCPLFQSDTCQNRRYYGTVTQRRAHVSYTKDGKLVTHREVKCVKHEEVSQRDLSNSFMKISSFFYFHSWVAAHQAKQFDSCIDNLPLDSLVVLLDFSMNYKVSSPNTTILVSAAHTYLSCCMLARPNIREASSKSGGPHIRRHCCRLLYITEQATGQSSGPNLTCTCLLI